MALGDTNAVDLYYSNETTWGEAPAGGALTQIRHTGESLAYAKESVQSEVIRSDRMRDSVLEVGYSAGGDINFELAYGSFDDFLAVLMSSAWSTPLAIAGNAAVDGTLEKYTAAASFFDDVVVGQWIKVAGFHETANNGIKRVTAKAVDGSTITVDSNLTEEHTEIITMTGSYIRNGTTKKSVLLEKRFTDLTTPEYVYYNGMRIGSMALDITAMQAITGSFAFTGKSSVMSHSTVGGSDVAASAAVPMTASANVGTIEKDYDALATALRSISMTVNNNPRRQMQIGSTAAAGIGLGFFEVTGTIQAYFEDSSLYDLLTGHTAVSLGWHCTDTDGNVLIFTIPSLYFMSGDPTAPSGNDDVMLPLEFAAIRQSTLNCMLQIDKIPV